MPKRYVVRFEVEAEDDEAMLRLCRYVEESVAYYSDIAPQEDIEVCFDGA